VERKENCTVQENHIEVPITIFSRVLRSRINRRMETLNAFFSCGGLGLVRLSIDEAAVTDASAQHGKADWEASPQRL